MQARVVPRLPGPFHRLYTFYRPAAYTGARRGELLNLRWADVDWRAPATPVRGSVGIVDGERLEGTTKGGQERVVSLDLGTVDVLRAHRRHRDAGPTGSTPISCSAHRLWTAYPDVRWHRTYT